MSHIFAQSERFPRQLAGDIEKHDSEPWTEATMFSFSVQSERLKGAALQLDCIPFVGHNCACFFFLSLWAQSIFTLYPHFSYCNKLYGEKQQPVKFVVLLNNDQWWRWWWWTKEQNWTDEDSTHDLSTSGKFPVGAKSAAVQRTLLDLWYMQFSKAAISCQGVSSRWDLGKKCLLSGASVRCE